MASEQDPPKSIDLEALNLGPLARKARAATFAPNWKTVLAVDGTIGGVLVVLGVVLANWVTWAGWILIILGLTYVFMVVRRFLQWRWLRQQAGLD